MPNFKVAQIKNSEHVGVLELTLSPSKPCFIIQIVMLAEKDDGCPALGDEINIEFKKPVTESDTEPVAEPVKENENA